MKFFLSKISQKKKPKKNKMTNKSFNKFEKEMKNKYSGRDMMVKGKKVNFETNIKN